MATKIEESELRPDIERMILEGQSLAKVAEWAKQHGLNISHQTVKRHKEVHNLIPASNTQAGLSDSDIEQITDESISHVELPEINTPDDAVNYSREAGQRIYAYLVAITEKRVKDHANSLTRFPSTEIAAVKNWMSILGSMSGDKDNVTTDESKKE